MNIQDFCAEQLLVEHITALTHYLNQDRRIIRLFNALALLPDFLLAAIVNAVFRDVQNCLLQPFGWSFRNNEMSNYGCGILHEWIVSKETFWQIIAFCFHSNILSYKTFPEVTAPKSTESTNSTMPAYYNYYITKE